MEPRNYDENPIRSRVVYDYETSKEFRKFHYRKTWRKSLLYLCFALGWLLLSPVEGDGASRYIRYLSLLCALYGVYHFLWSKGVFYTKRKYERMKGRVNAGVAVESAQTFYQTEFTEIVEQDGMQGDVRMRYDKLEKVGETRLCFYLYSSPRQAVCVDKSQLQNGRSAELRGLLQAALPPKRYVSTVG